MATAGTANRVPSAADSTHAVLRRRRLLRWGAVATATALLIASPTLVAAAFAPTGVALTPQQVVSAAQASSDVPHQGLVQVEGRLGLPSLPFAGNAFGLLDQGTRVRTWWASPTSWRTDTLSAGGQVEQFAIPGATRSWDYERRTVTMLADTEGLRTPRTVDLMPPAAARWLLSLAGPTDRAVLLAPRVVAGVFASGAEVVSSEADSSLAAVDVWVEPSSGLPVQVDAYVRGFAVPVFSSYFLDLSLSTPDPAVLSPRLDPSADVHVQRFDLLSFLRSVGTATLPTWLAGLPRTTDASAVPAGVGTYGTGYARAVLLQLPDRLLGRVQATIGASSAAGSSSVRAFGGQAAILRTPTLQLAVLATKAGGGFLLVGALTTKAMDAAVQDVLQELADVPPSSVTG